MNAVELAAEVAYRQADCRRTFAAGLVGYRGPNLDTPRGHLVARVDAARRLFARHHDHTAEIALVQAEAALEAFDERAESTG